MTATDPWAAALDDFESTLAVCEAALALAEDAEPPAPFAPPVIEEAFPERLAERAGILLGRAADLRVRLEAEQQRIREELARLPRAVSATRPAAAHIDFGA